MEGKVTLRDIADEAGLSITSVSLVLNDRPCRLSEESRRRIREIAKRRHYVPNQIARSLVTSKSYTLGLIIPNIESRFFASFAKALEERARKDGYALFITNTNDRASADLQLMQMLVQRGVDGLIVVASNENYQDEGLLEAFRNLPVPYVMTDRVFDGVDCDKVLFDSELGGYLATMHLLEHGHRRIAAVLNTLGSNTGRQRRLGYERALAEYGIEVDQALEVESDYHITSGYEAAKQVVDTDATAIFASSDNIALGVLKYLSEQKLRVPDDYSLVSYDNSSADMLFEPALTAVDQNVELLADHAFGLLANRLEGAAGDSACEILPPRLVVRDSVRSL